MTFGSNSVVKITDQNSNILQQKQRSAGAGKAWATAAEKHN